METILKGTGVEVIIGSGRPTVIIGDRINAAKGGKLVDALHNTDMSLINQEARVQAEAGADVINVSVRSVGVDEKTVLPKVVKAVAEAVPLPISIDTEEPEALAAALEVCPGRPLVNSISCKESALNTLLPLAVQRGAAVIGIALDDEGVPTTIEERVEMAREVLRRSITAGIAREDVILNPLALAVDDDPSAALVTLTTIAQLARVEAVNLTLRPSGVSHGLPNQESIENMLLATAIHHGVTCPIIDPLKGRRDILIADLLFGQDGALGRYIDFAS